MLLFINGQWLLRKYLHVGERLQCALCEISIMTDCKRIKIVVFYIVSRESLGSFQAILM